METDIQSRTSLLTMLYVSCFVLLLSTLRSSSFPVTNCTEAEGPCSCQHDVFYLKLHCKDVNSGVRLRDVPSEIDAEDDGVEEMRSGIFEGLCVNKLFLHLPKLRNVEDFAFYDLRKCLKMLMLLNGKLEIIPINALKSLLHLKFLSLYNQQIRSVAFLQRLSIENLVLSHNKISTVAKDAFPRKLKTLFLNHNQIKNLNGSLLHLKDLYWFFISNNKLSSLSGELSGLKSLTSLTASYNSIEDLNGTFKDLKNLQTLNLSYNRIKKLKNHLHGLPNLVILNVSHNLISSLRGKEFVHMVNLEILDLSNNNLEGVSDAFLQLKNLRHLDLSGNILNVLDSSLICLNQLKKLDISKNFLSNLDWLIDSNNHHNCSLTNLNAVMSLHVADNPLQCQSFQEAKIVIDSHKMVVHGSPSC